MMTTTRTVCLAGALLFLEGGRLTAQELLFGSEPLPQAMSNLEKVLISKDGKSWEIHISKEGVGRLVQVVGLGSEKNTSATLACSSSRQIPLDNQRWVVAKGNCLLKFKPAVGAIGAEDVKLRVAAATMDSNRLSNPPSDDQLSKADQDPVRVDLLLKGAALSDIKDPSDGQASSKWTDRLRRPILIGGIIGVLALIVSFFLLKYWKALSSKLSELGGRHTEFSAVPLKASVPARLGRQDSIPLTDQSKRETWVEQTLNEHSRKLHEFELKANDLEARIQQAAEQCASMLIANGEEASRQLLEIRNDEARRLHEVESRITAVEEDLSGHLANQTSRLQELFRDLPALAELSAAVRVIHGSELARLEGQLVSAAKQGALSRPKLDSLQVESRGLVDVIHGYAQAAGNLNKEQTTKRLGQVFDGANVLNNELAGLGQLTSAQKYGFFVEMSLLEQNPLSKDLAMALTREALKLSDPETYYRKRLVALKVQACVAAIDLADLDLDAERRNLGLQEALGKLTLTLGMTQIDPQRNDKLQAAEHQVAQFARRTPGAMPGAIAHTMARGLQRGSEVIRKASVLLYE